MYRGSMTIRLKALGWAIVLTVFCFQDAIRTLIPQIIYLDEAAALIFFAYFLLDSIKTRVNRSDLVIAGVVIMLCAIGFIGNAFSNVQNAFSAQLRDVFNIFKYILVLWGACRYFGKYDSKKYVIHYMALFLKFMIVFATICMVLNWITDIGMHTDYRSGIRTFQFVFIRVGSLYNSCVMWLVILTAERYCNQPKYNGIFIALTLVIMCSTLRIRAFAFVILYVVVYYLIILNTKKKQWSLYAFLTVILIALIGKDQFDLYFTGDTARSVLQRYGIITAKEYFPFGAGFGTYGTAVAAQTESILYDQYMFSRYWGLGKGGNRSFLVDNFWPAMMGEFGFVGAGLMVLLIALVIKKLYVGADNPYSRVCVIFGMGTLVLASTVTSSFLACVPLTMILSMVYQLDREQTPVNTKRMVI